MQTIPFNDLGRAHRAHAEEIEEAARRVLRSGWYVLGPETTAFEEEFAALCGTTGAVGVANGTDGLELALRASGVEPGDEVITSANAGGYSSVATVAIGATPVYADVDPCTLALRPDTVAAACTPATRAIVVTHLYGIVADVDAMRDSVPASVALIEDCSQAHGARTGGRRVGSVGDIGVFSCYPTKNLGAVGDAAVVVSDDGGLLERVRRLGQYGWSSRNDATLPGGRNSRLDELQAAVLRAKLPHLDAANTRRRAIAERWRLALAAGPEVATVAPAPGGDDVAHLCVIRHRRRDRARTALHEAGVATGVHFAHPDHRQAAFAERGRPAGPLPVTEAACDEVLSLPCFPELTDDEVADAIDRTRSVLDRLASEPAG